MSVRRGVGVVLPHPSSELFGRSLSDRGSWQLVRKQLGLQAHHGILYSTSQHSTTWWSGQKLVRKQFGTESSIPPVNTAPHSKAVGSIAFDEKEVGLRAQHGTLCSTSQHSTTSTWQSDRKLLRKQALELSMEPSIPPVNTAPHSSQMKSLWRNVRA